MLSAICGLDIQGAYQGMVERGLSARTVRYGHSVLRSAMRQAIRWRLLAKDPTTGAQLPRQRRSRVAGADGGPIAAVCRDRDENSLRPSLRGCAHHGRTPQRVPRLEVAGHRLGARHRERRADARESAWRLAFCRDETSPQPTRHQAAGVGAGALEGSASDDELKIRIEISLRNDFLFR